MSDQRDGGIAWCDVTWNPVRGCSRVSPGCEHCYAERQAHRFSGPGGPYEGLTRLTAAGPRWTGEVRFVPVMLVAPLRWMKSRRVFVNAMSDLFHEALRADDIWCVFDVMIHAPQHVFMVLTKRPQHMHRLLTLWRKPEQPLALPHSPGARDLIAHIWLGVSVENQATADERIPLLLDTPAAHRFVSYEPALGPVDFSRYLNCGAESWVEGHPESPNPRWPGGFTRRLPHVEWLIIGGESGPGARPFDVTWARSTIAVCKMAGVPVFYKQGGASNACAHDRKGGCLDCAPSDLRIREWPHVTR